jgi:peptidylprolyl isomerase
MIAILFAALALSAAGCGDDSDSDSGEETTAAETTAGGDATEAAQDEVDTSTKPVVESPGGEPPGAFLVEDIVVGKGREAKQGDTVEVQYVGIDYETGEQFDASWDRGEPFEFSLGGGEVIAGWDQGVEGMKVGGRRELVIPPDLAYGPSGQPPDIAPNATLIFVIDLLGVQPG